MHLQYFMTRISVYLKSIWTPKYALFEIKILQISDFASCAKFSVLKIIRYTVYAIAKKETIVINLKNEVGIQVI